MELSAFGQFSSTTTHDVIYSSQVQLREANQQSRLAPA